MKIFVSSLCQGGQNGPFLTIYLDLTTLSINNLGFWYFHMREEGDAFCNRSPRRLRAGLLFATAS
jgi:hypothetical protein